MEEGDEEVDNADKEDPALNKTATLDQSLVNNTLVTFKASQENPPISEDKPKNPGQFDEIVQRQDLFDS